MKRWGLTECEEGGWVLYSDYKKLELRLLQEISDDLSLHGHGLAAARVERRIMLLAPQNDGVKNG
jgi:hypothetical protein